MTKLNTDQLIDLNLLLSIEGIGPGKIRVLLSKFKSIKNILSSDYNSLISTNGISTNLAARIHRINDSREKIKTYTISELEKLNKLKARRIPAAIKKDI